MNIDMNPCMGNLPQMITTNSSQKNIVGSQLVCRILPLLHKELEAKVLIVHSHTKHRYLFTVYKDKLHFFILIYKAIFNVPPTLKFEQLTFQTLGKF